MRQFLVSDWSAFDSQIVMYLKRNAIHTSCYKHPVTSAFLPLPSNSDDVDDVFIPRLLAQGGEKVETEREVE